MKIVVVMKNVRKFGREQVQVEFYRVNFVVQTLKPFSFLVFSHPALAKKTQNSLVLVTNW